MQLLSRVVPSLAATALVVAACGSSPQGSERSPSQGSPTTVTVTDVAGVPSAFLMYGKRAGHFREHGLKLQVETAAGGAAIIPGVVSGTYDFGGSNVMSALVATAKGVPVSMVAPGTSERTTPDRAFGAILVPADSGISEPADLAGKTIAINTLDGIAHLTTKISLRNHGVDPASVELTEIEFPNMLAPLEKGDIDAAWEIEPFLTMGRQGGARPVLWPYLETKPGMQVGSYVTSKRYLSQNPEVVKAFQAGVADTARAVDEDPAKFRKALPELTELSAAAAQEMRLPRWRTEVSRSTLELINEKSAELGFIDKPADIATMLAPGAAG